MASLNYSTIRIADVDCLSVDPDQVVFDRKQYSDPKLFGLIADKLQIEKVVVSADYARCPLSLFITVVPGTEFAVRRDGVFAKYLVSAGICQRTVGGSVNPDNCLSKNIYVFRSWVEPHQLLSAGLVGLKLPQSDRWEPFEIRGRDE